MGVDYNKIVSLSAEITAMHGRQGSSHHSKARLHKHLLLKKHSLRTHNHYQESPESTPPSSPSPQPIHTRPYEPNLIRLFQRMGPDWQRVSKQLKEATTYDLTPSQVKTQFIQLLKKLLSSTRGLNPLHLARPLSLKQLALLVQQGARLEEDNKNQEAALFAHQCRQTLSQLLLASSQEDAEIGKLRQLTLLCRKVHSRRHGSKAETAGQSQREQIEEEQKERGYQSDSSSAFQEPLLAPFAHPPAPQPYQNDYDDSDSQPAQPSIEIADEQAGIRALLQQSGLLQFQAGEAKRKAKLGSGVQSVASCSQNLNNESYQHFYEESELQRDCYWKQQCRPTD